MRDDNKKSIVAGFVFLALSIALMIGAYMIKLDQQTDIGANFMPMVCGIVLCILSVTLIFTSAVSLKSAGASAAVGEDEVPPDNKSVLLTIMLLLVYVALLEPIGFVICSIFYLFFQMIILEVELTKKKVILFAIISIAVAIIIFNIFYNLFDLMLPLGILG